MWNGSYIDSSVKMTPAQFKEARQSLGLNQHQLAAMLGLGSQTRISAIENGATITPMCQRLMQAYAAGYRPNDWPT